MKDLLLAIDVGSQSLRAVAFDAGGEAVAINRVPLSAPEEPHPGWAELRPEYYWEALCRASRGLAAEVDPERFAALAVTGQRSTLVNLGRDGRPLRPAIVWMDQRVVEGPLAPLPLPWRLAFLVAGQSGTVDYLRRQCELNWLAAHQPDVWAATHKALLLSGYLHYRLTGEFRDSAAQQVGYVPFDHRRQRWAGSWNWKWRAVKVAPRMLPELVPAGETLGKLSASAAGQCGLCPATPVVATAADKACEALGAGCLEASSACVSLGTQASISINSARYFEPISMLPAFPSALPGRHAPEITVVRGLWMVSWFKEQFAGTEVARAQREGLSAEELLDELLDQAPPGALGLTLQPFWGGGLRYPGVEAKGAVIGFGAAHGKAHLYRAILEGLCYALRDGLERIERKSPGIEVLRVAGGGSDSSRLVQMVADVLGRPAERPHTAQASALGAAISAAVAAGLHRDYPRAVAAMCRVGARVEPDPGNALLYDRLYRRVYRKMYSRLRGLYRAIREIVGYPR